MGFQRLARVVGSQCTWRPMMRAPYWKEQADGLRRHVTDLIGDASVAFVEESDPRPWCLSISFNAVHAEDNDKEDHFPWPQVVDGMYDNTEMPPPRLADPAIFESQPDFLKSSLNRTRFFWRWDTPQKYQKNMRAYYRMISGVDHAAPGAATSVSSRGKIRLPVGFLCVRRIIAVATRFGP